MIAPSHDCPGDQESENGKATDMPPIARPELQQVIATQLLVDFAEDVAHKNPEPWWKAITISARPE
jgi:hypothetical protein